MYKGGGGFTVRKLGDLELIILTQSPPLAYYKIPGYLGVRVREEEDRDDRPVRQLWIPEGRPEQQPETNRS